jgi:choline-glycine betaine transporter
MIRTFWQALIGFVLSGVLLLANAALDVLHGQSTGTAAAALTMVLTVLVAIIKNIQDNKKDDGESSGTQD